jgi:hypothetical protein
LHFKEQILLFTGNWDLYLQKPAVLSAYSGDFLTQFFLLRGGGSITLVLLLFLFWQGVRISLKRLGIKQPAGIIALLPVAVEASLVCIVEYPLSMLTGAVMSTWLFVLLSAIKNSACFRICGALFTVGIYLSAGAHFAIFPILLIFYEWANRKAYSYAIIILLLAAITPLFAGYFYYLTPAQAFFYPVTDWFFQKSCFTYLCTEATLILACLLVFIQSRQWITGIMVCLTVTSGFYLTNDSRKEYDLAVSCEAYFGNWKRVKSLCRSHKYNTWLSAYYENLAFAREGKLPDELFTRYQPAHFGLFLETSSEIPYIRMMSCPDAPMVCGDMEQAQHSAMLGMLYSSGHCSSRLARKLVEIYLNNGEQEAAKKYEYLLSKTRFHRSRTYNPTAQPYLAQTDSLFAPNDWHCSLSALLKSNPENKIAADYLLCYDLLRKDLQTFKTDYDTFYHTNFGTNPPSVYQQALLMCLNEEDNSYQELLAYYHIRQVTYDESKQFLSDLEKDRKQSELMKRNFGATYWFYYFYAQLK